VNVAIAQANKSTTDVRIAVARLLGVFVTPNLPRMETIPANAADASASKIQLVMGLTFLAK
jgi:hypothetical protein